VSTRLTEAEKLAIVAVVEFASIPENVYVPGPNAKVPGRDPRHVFRVGNTRCVFSISRFRAGLYRHLTLSQADKKTYPDAEVVEEIARCFGFVGSPTNWASAANQQQGCLVVMQRVGD
jgi:hypothetical protein